MKKQPNILVICSDEHHRLMSGYMGHPQVQTPNLDRLAARGTTFENAYCTSPVCTPSRMSFITGKYVHDIGSWFIGVPLDPAEMTWPRRLHEAGIPSTMLGKMDFCGRYQSGGFTNFDIIDKRGAFDPYPRAAPLAARLKGYIRPDKRRRIQKSGVRADVVTDGRDGYNDSLGFYDHDRIMMEKAKGYLREKGAAGGKDPWALYVGLVYPHWPFTVPEQYAKLYDPDQVELPVDCKLPRNDKLPPQLQHLQRGQDLEELSEEDVRRTIAIYYAMITAMDAMIGEILDELENQGMLEDTYIIYTSDHGEALGEHGLFYKQSPYDASVSVPFILSGPDVPRGKRMVEPVSLIDLYPTVMDMAKLEWESDRPGQSLLAVARGQEQVRGNVFAEYHGNFMPSDWYLIRQGNYKYVRFSEGPSLLFDLDEDPNELDNLCGKDEYGKLVESLEHRLRTIVDPEAVSLRAKRDLGLIGPNGEDYTQTLTVQQLRDAQKEGKIPFQAEFEKDYEGEMI